MSGTKEFGREGGTIGRSLESDWVLPDGQRYVSSRHASIDYRSGSYYIVDTSTNGDGISHCSAPKRNRAAMSETSGSYSQSEV